MIALNKQGYNPIDDSSKSGYRRPPKDPACICDYFAQLMGIEDEGKFMHLEMAAMLTSPETFFTEKPVWA